MPKGLDKSATAACACAAAFAQAGASGATLVSQSRAAESFALASDGAMVVEDPVSFVSTLPGAFGESADSHAAVGVATATGTADQTSVVRAQRVTMNSTVFAMAGALTPAFARADGESRLRVTFDLTQDESWALDADAAITGASFGSVVFVSLTVDGAILREFSTSLGWTSAHETIALDPGHYVLDINVSATLDSQGAAGSDQTGASLAFSFIRQSPPCSGDANGDLLVDFLDLNHVLSDFGAVAPGLVGDVDFDGDCDFTDLNTVLSSFGTTC